MDKNNAPPSMAERWAYVLEEFREPFPKELIQKAAVSYAFIPVAASQADREISYVRPGPYMDRLNAVLGRHGFGWRYSIVDTGLLFEEIYLWTKYVFEIFDLETKNVVHSAEAIGYSRIKFSDGRFAPIDHKQKVIFGGALKQVLRRLGMGHELYEDDRADAFDDVLPETRKPATPPKPSPTQPVTNRQLMAIHTAAAAYQGLNPSFIFKTKRNEVGPDDCKLLELAMTIAGRKVDGLRELTQAEASEVINKLNEYIKNKKEKMKEEKGGDDF